MHDSILKTKMHKNILYPEKQRCYNHISLSVMSNKKILDNFVNPNKILDKFQKKVNLVPWT